jgi:hypothetical protein
MFGVNPVDAPIESAAVENLLQTVQNLFGGVVAGAAVNKNLHGDKKLCTFAGANIVKNDETECEYK